MSSVPPEDGRRRFIYDDGRVLVVISYGPEDGGVLEVVRILLEHAERRACRERVEAES